MSKFHGTGLALLGVAIENADINGGFSILGRASILLMVNLNYVAMIHDAAGNSNDEGTGRARASLSQRTTTFASGLLSR